MGLTTDRNDPNLHVVKPNGQNATYLILSEEERAKGFVRPLRTKYRHVGIDYCLAAITVDGKAFLCGQLRLHDGECGGLLFETRPKGGCGSTTSMGYELCATYARD